MADLLQVPTMDPYLFYVGRSVGIPPPDKMEAINISPAGVQPEWRVEERQFVKWCKHKRIILLR